MRPLSRVAIVLGVVLVAASAVAEPIPQDVEDLLRRYVAAWEARDVFSLIELSPSGSPVFLSLLDQKHLNHIVQTKVTIRDVEVRRHDDIIDGRTVTFVKEQEDVQAAGTVTRGLAKIELIVQPEAGLPRIVSHRVVPFDGATGARYRPDDASSWGPEHAPLETRFYVGYRALQRGDCGAALPHFHAVLAAAGDDAAGLPFDYATGQARFVAQVAYFAAVCERRSGDATQATTLARRALELSPTFALALNFLADRALERNAPGEAVELWTRSISAFPEQPDVVAERDFYQKAARFYPDPDLRERFLGVRGLPPTKATSKLLALSKRSQGEPETRRRLAVAYLESMQPEKAKRVLTENDYLHPHDLETQYLLGRTSLALQRLDDAAALLARVWSRSPGYRDTAVLLTEVYGALHRYPDAVGLLKETLALHPRDPGVFYKLATYSLHLGRRDEARSYLRQAAGLHPPTPLRRAIYEAIQAL